MFVALVTHLDRDANRHPGSRTSFTRCGFFDHKMGEARSRWGWRRVGQQKFRSLTIVTRWYWGGTPPHTTGLLKSLRYGEFSRKSMDLNSLTYKVLIIKELA